MNSAEQQNKEEGAHEGQQAGSSEDRHAEETRDDEE